MTTSPLNPPPPRRPTTPPESGARKKILVVDDDVDTARLVARALSRDYDVRVAHDGREGLAAAFASPPDLLVTDIAMPGMDGIEMVHQMRAAVDRKFPILFLTARDEPRDVVAAIGAGARGFLTKPIQLDQFEARVRSALSRP